MQELARQHVAYLREQDLGRIATAGLDCQPHVTPVTFELSEDERSIIIPGFDLDSRKYRDLRQNARVSFVVDDVVSYDPFVARGLTIRGSAEVFEHGGEWHSEGIGGAWVRIRPERVVAWGLDEVDR